MSMTSVWRACSMRSRLSTPAREQHATKTLENIGIKAGQVINRPRVVYEQLRAGVLSLERIEHARHTLVIDMCHGTSFR